MDIRPDHANLLDDVNNVCTVAPEAVPVGSRILIRPGERVPLDGVVEEGSSSLDTAALTGESLPVDKEPGSAVSSATLTTMMTEVPPIARFLISGSRLPATMGSRATIPR